MKESNKILAAMVFLSFLASAYFYASMPDKIVSHWDALGEPNGYMGKFWGLFLVPFMLVAFWILFASIPKIDPLKENIKEFEKEYNTLIILFFVFMLCIQLQSILWNIGLKIDFSITMPILLGVLFFYLGVLLKSAKRNWFVGIRTPWTLSNENVWNKTHKLGAKFFKISGLISVTGVFFKEYFVYFSIAPIILASIYLVIYSYFLYEKENKKKQN